MTAERPELDPDAPARLRVMTLWPMVPEQARQLAELGMDRRRLALGYPRARTRAARPPPVHEAQDNPAVAAAIAASELYQTAQRALHFQDRILIDGKFVQPCPWTGRPVATTKCLPVANCVFYRFESQARSREPFFVIAGLYSRGFARFALWLPQQDLIIRLQGGVSDASLRGLVGAYVRTASAAGADYLGYLADTAPARTAVMLCTPPFPHHLWNELPGLERLLQSVDLARHPGNIYVLAQPLGPVAEIYPELAPRLRPCTLPELLLRQFANNELLVRPGSLLLPEAVLARVRSVAAHRVSASTQALLAEFGQTPLPTLGITLRVHNRRWRSQEGGIVALIRALQRRKLRFRVVLFGFSLPLEPMQPRRLAPLIEAEQQLCASIAAKCPGIAVTSLVGESIFDCIALAPTLDFYIANHGTIQHKVGWFTEAPGLVHANRVTLLRRQAFFTTLVAREGGRPPRYLSADVVTDVADADADAVAPPPLAPDDADTDDADDANPVVPPAGRGNLQDYDFDWRELLPATLAALRAVAATGAGHADGAS